jgi:hypothetical protein
MPRHFRIHPALGVARVGDSATGFYVGPEQPDVPANWSNGTFDSFRDNSGRIKRQAARFRVFEYFPDDKGRLASPKEVTIGDEIVDIEWRVHIANRKGSFFTFNGQKGAEDLYVARSQKPGDAPEKEGGDGDPPRTNLRNSSVTNNRAAVLDIDPGEHIVSKDNQKAVLTNPNKNVPMISDLGELQWVDNGRLNVLGGHGISGSTENPPRPIDEYANNDTWCDDVGDGPVRARVKLQDGTSVDADPAWVTVGPPDFAPGIGNVVSLYDTLWDIAVQHLPVPADNALFSHEPLSTLSEHKRCWEASGNQSLAGYKPSFTREIYPLLSRAFRARWAFMYPGLGHQLHFQLMEWSRLSVADGGAERDEGRDARQFVFKQMRDPKAQTLAWKQMPRGLGDDYDDLDGDSPLPTSLLNLTHIQFALLEQWAAGNFVADWPGGDAELDVPAPREVTPEGLDRAALENCVGGPFYPGIEVSWIVRRPELYAEPFRLNVSKSDGDEPPIGALTFRSGFFSQQMAQPWQADFYDCHKEEHRSPAPDNDPYTYMWWTAQRPDDVFPHGSQGVAAAKQLPWVRQFFGQRDQATFESDIERFRQMQARWSQLRFILGNRDWFEEEP